MKKTFISLFLVLAVISFAKAQHYTVRHSDFNSVSISFKSDKIQVEDVKTTQGYFSQISMADYQNSITVGCPQLPIMTKLIEIPLCDSVIATVSNAQYDEFDASELGITHPIYPAQISYPKSYSGERTFTQNLEVYQTNQFYAEPLVSVQKSGTMRDVTMASISVAPVQYNPVTNRVRIYKTIDVNVTFANANIPGTYELKSRYGSPMFSLASNAVINSMAQTRYEFSGAPIKYLIIVNSMFADNDQLNLFINWKKRLGYIVEVAYTSDPNVGTTTTSIKNYILTHYNNATAENPAPTFLLLIGDVAQLPSFSCSTLNNHVSDLYYATWTSNDNLPDCYYGRFSAQNVNQLIPQIEKTLMYEQYTMEDPSYLGKAVLIAGTDAYNAPTYGDGQINYIYNNYINTNSTTHTYTTVYKHNYNCSSQAATIRSEIGAGVGWANYTAHGGETGWSDPSFSNSHVSAMNNANKYGVMIGNCCLTGKFNVSSDCFGEVLLRTPNKGAMAYIGGSEVTYWDEDYYWAVGVRSSISANPTYDANNLGANDRIFHTHGESPRNWTSCISAFLQSGNMSVQSSSSSRKLYYWEIYHLFGDPSIRPYLGIPTQMMVTADDVIMVGATTYDVIAAPYAYVALTYNNNVVCAAFADGNGNATLNLPALTPGEYELAIGAQNKIQYFQTVNAIVPEGAYIVTTDVALSATSAPDAGSIIDWNLSVKNMGVDAASDAYAKMTSETQGVTILTDSVYIGSIAVDGIRDFSNAFRTKLSEDFEDGDMALFTVTVYWGSSNSSKIVSTTVNAANLEVANYTISNVNNTSSFAPGDLVTITFTNKNTGHATLQQATVDLTCNYTGAPVIDPAITISTLAPNQTVNNIFHVQISGDVADHTIIPFYHHRIYNNKHFIDTVYLSIGTAMEDFESGNFSQYDWSNASNHPWEITTESPYSGTYCVRSQTGLSRNQTSAMQITINSFQAGNISYFRKVSSEANWDKFKFYIDGTEMESQSGTLSWSQASFPVTAGTHTYKFEYSKDGSQDIGSDCAWVDNVIFPGYGTLAPNDTIDSVVGITNFNIPSANVSIYPNPTSGQLTVNSNEAIESVIIYDLSGRIVEMQNINAETTAHLNVAHLNSGIYFIKTQLLNNQTKTSKFIKQ